jgi:hypothetical protein
MEFTYDVELKPGQPLSLPKEAAQIIGPGHWQVSIRPLEPGAVEPARDHSAFLNSYAPEDEGLYNNYSAR